MKLLEELPSAVAHRPPARRPGRTLAALSAFLVTAAAGGVVLVTAADDDLTRSDWASSVSTVCARVAEQHPVMTEDAAARTAAGNAAAVGAATRALAAAVRNLPVPSGDAAVTSAVAAGDRAEAAWDELAGTRSEAGELTEAVELTAAFVAEVTSVGADCSALS